MPVPDSNGEEWDRLELATALDALFELVLHGEYNGIDSVRRARDGLELRSAALGVIEVNALIHFDLYGNVINSASRTLSAKRTSGRK
jgi:hypothetical protein